MAVLVALLLVQSVKPLAEIPCRIVQNLVLLDVRLNDRKTVALLDSGADATYADEAVALAVGATKGRAFTANGAGGQGIAGWEAKGLALTFPGLSAKRPVGRAFPLHFPIPGAPKVEVILGHELFADYVVEIDYARAKVRLYNGKTYRPPSGARLVPLRFDWGVHFASLNIALPGGPPRSIQVLVDTGVNVGLYLTAAYARRERLAERFPDAASVPEGMGIGGETRSRLLSGAKLRLNGQSFDVAAWFDLSGGGVTGPDAMFDGLLGGDFLRRFLVTFDEPHGHLILRASGG